MAYNSLVSLHCISGITYGNLASLPSRVVGGGCSSPNSELERVTPGPSNLVPWNPLASGLV